MDNIWQPAIELSKHPIVAPMFPLDGVFLFPGQVMPLHIFEPRYRQMIEDVLDGPGRIVMGTIVADQSEADDKDQDPSVLPIAGIGEIARHERLEDDRFGILLLGLARVRLEEIESDRLYRKVRCEAICEAPPEYDDEPAVQQALLEAIHKRTGLAIKDEGYQASTSQLADILAQSLHVPQSLMEEIFTEFDVCQRVDKVLAAHEEFPAKPD